jgi:hypothetical protein
MASHSGVTINGWRFSYSKRVQIALVGKDNELITTWGVKVAIMFAGLVAALSVLAACFTNLFPAWRTV